MVFVVEEELGKLGMDGILAYFSCVRGEQHRTDKRVYILQRWVEKWKNFVDVTDVDQINNGDRLTVVLESTNPAVVNVAVSDPYLRINSFLEPSISRRTSIDMINPPTSHVFTQYLRMCNI